MSKCRHLGATVFMWRKASTMSEAPRKIDTFSSRLLKKTHMLRCAQSPRSKGTVQAVQHGQTVQNVEEHEPRTRITTTARLASEIFLSSLQSGFFSNLLAMGSEPSKFFLYSLACHDLGPKRLWQIFCAFLDTDTNGRCLVRIASQSNT